MDDDATFDAIVVGSGASGSWAAKELAERGLKTLLLEAGRNLDPATDFPLPKDEEASRIRLFDRMAGFLGGQSIQARCMSFSRATRHLFVDDRENPYRTAPGSRFNWFRSRQVGGRLHLWGRNALRFSDHNLKPSLQDGFGDDWPLSYGDLEPWYDRVEQFLGVNGSAAGIEGIPDGHYEAPHKLTSAEQRILAEMASKWPDRPATTCRIIKHNPERIPLQISEALKTGNLTLQSDAVVSHIDINEETGMATGVSYYDRSSRQKKTARARVVMLCASTIETLRIMLNSKSERHPNGIGNSSGNLGHFLTDHVMVFQAGPLDEIETDSGRDPYDFGAQSGIYVPNFRNLSGDEGRGFLRGYALLGSLGRIEPGWFFMAIGEMLPRYENFVELHSSKRDAWGIPVAKIHCEHSDNERAMVRDMTESLNEVVRDFGLTESQLGKEGLLGRIAYRFAAPMIYTPEGALVPGSAIHETGGACMGDDPARHVLNRHNQCWDAKNLFVTDSASFPTSPYQNPGLTIMALSARAANFASDQIVAGKF